LNYPISAVGALLTCRLVVCNGDDKVW